jgi:PTH1 family peptidyl-tRNA hydrolase
MYAIVGLGNPGKKYEKTRHNVGFRVIDKLAREWGVSVKKVQFQSLVGETFRNGEKVLLLKPQTYMNESGRAVLDLVQYYQIPEENVIVVYDDIDFEVGVLKVRKRGSAGSHNGMKSVIFQLKSDAFPRVRLGIGKQPTYMDLANYVLSGFTSKEEKILESVVDAACDAVETVISDDVEKAMNRTNHLNFQ